MAGCCSNMSTSIRGWVLWQARIAASCDMTAAYCTCGGGGDKGKAGLKQWHTCNR